MPKAIERLLATPRTTPFNPRIGPSPAVVPVMPFRPNSASPPEFPIDSAGPDGKAAGPAGATFLRTPALSALTAKRISINCLTAHLPRRSFDVPNNREWADEANGLRRFGLALVRDERYVLDDSAAARLVDKLIRQTCVAPIAERGRATDRAAVYARFVQLYRRHV